LTYAQPSLSLWLSSMFFLCPNSSSRRRRSASSDSGAIGHIHRPRFFCAHHSNSLSYARVYPLAMSTSSTHFTSLYLACADSSRILPTTSPSSFLVFVLSRQAASSSTTRRFTYSDLRLVAKNF
jgi:hypothetical protein